ncbi:MAG: hypothetical protein EZS28_036130, partial [Streblomastix strix]
MYTAVNRLQYYGQYVPDVLTQFSTMSYQASPYILWQAKILALSPNLFIQLTGALDLYDRLSENAANSIVNNGSSVKFIDLETQHYKSLYDSQSPLADTPIQCPFIGKKQQARPALKNKPKNQRQQQNRRLHQPQAHKQRLKDQKPIIQPQPVVQFIPKPKPQQAVYKQAQRAIPKNFVKQQYTASKQTVQKQDPRALPKDFVKQQQASKKSREGPVQPIRIVNKQQKYADKRRKHYQIKSQQKQLEREFKNQELNMEMMEQEQLQVRFQRFESEPVRYDLLSQLIEDKRANFKDEQIEYAGGN